VALGVYAKCSYFILQTMLTLSLHKKITSMMHCRKATLEARRIEEKKTMQRR
jgi:hypothetical protein